MKFIERYEAVKKELGRIDFTDLLGLFAGWKWNVYGEPDGFQEPQGVCPDLQVWFLDEAQDVTPLSWSVFQRLTRQPAVTWVYLSGDPFQAIYDWAGADHSILLDSECDKERTMPQSYRCPSKVLSAGENVLKGCSDYFDRGIAPREEGGEVVESTLDLLSEHIASAAGGSVLCLSRCNFQQAVFAAKLDDLGIPWSPVRGMGGWNRPSLFKACEAMLDLEQGYGIRADQWGSVIELLPTTGDDVPGLRRGIKAHFDKATGEVRTIDSVDGWGANRLLIEAIKSGQWPTVIKDKNATWAQRWRGAVDRFGLDLIRKPQIRCGTIHSVKGAEADVVLLSTGATRKIMASANKDRTSEDSERRLAYVGFTRARKSVVVLRDSTAMRRSAEHRFIMEGF